MSNRDLLDNPLNDFEVELLDAYQALKRLAGHPDAPPCVVRNVKKAVAVLWQPVTDLALEYEHLDDLQV